MPLTPADLPEGPCRQIMDIWCDLRGQDPIPLADRLRIDSLPLSLLPKLALVTEAATPSPIIAFCGAEAAMFLGAEPTGRPLLDFVPPEKHAFTLALYAAMAADPSPLMLWDEMGTGEDVLLNVMRLLLPFVRPDGGLDRLLALVFHQPTGSGLARRSRIVPSGLSVLRRQGERIAVPPPPVRTDILPDGRP